MSDADMKVELLEARRLDRSTAPNGSERPDVGKSGRVDDETEEDAPDRADGSIKARMDR